MMRLAWFAFPGLLAAAFLTQVQDRSKAAEVVDPKAKDRAAVERAALDYVEGLYQVKPEWIERSVSKDLTKYGFYRPAGAKEYRGAAAMTYERLVKLAAEWNKKGRLPKSPVKKVEVLDVLDRTAAVKLTAHWGIDYMHLTKIEGKWQIRHVLWQTPPPDADYRKPRKRQ